MANEGSRYDYDITTGERNYGFGGGREAGRSRNSMFGYGGGRDEERGRDDDDHIRSRGRSDRGDGESGGWTGSGRSSAYDQDDRMTGGGWTQERENFSLRRDRHRDEDRHEHRGRGHDAHREDSERRGGGWGAGLGGLGAGLMGGSRGGERDRDRDRDRDQDGERMRGREDDREQGRERFGPDDDRDGLPIDETSRLIASNKVEGTAVYGNDGARLGSIYNFMVDKRSGKVEYAVMSYGGMLGMGARYYPLPWEMLTYDTRRGGYHIDMRERDLRNAPSFDRHTEPRFDQDYSRHVHGWYGTR